MLRLTELRLPLEHAPEALTAAVLQRLQLQPADLLELHIHKRSPDARKKSAPQFVYSLDLALADAAAEAAVLARFSADAHVKPTPDMAYRFVAQAPAGLPLRPVVVGFGPAGIFAALILSQSGFRPLVLERGRKVRERTKDTWDLWRRHELHPESNVQFGEGGAGTFSDGKLYSQIRDPRHLARKVLTEFVKAGAPEEILYVNRPHIGTFRLVSMVEKMRAEIEGLGGEIRFQARVEDLVIEAGQVRGVVLQNGATTETIRADHVVLALGHSARDTFEMLHARGVFMEAKPFAVGFRIEHPQSLIDKARYGSFAGHALLGAADYKLVHHASNKRDVLQFLHVPRRAGGRGDVGTRLCRHQRHEPVFAGRAQCQRRIGRECVTRGFCRFGSARGH